MRRAHPVLYLSAPHAVGYSLRRFQVRAGRRFFINFRGSTSYGDASPVRQRQHRRARLSGLIAGLDAGAGAVGGCGPDRCAGRQLRGYLTSWLIGHTDRFAAACSERAVNNWLSKVGTSDIGFMQHREIGADPWEDPLHYLRRSPIFYVRSIRTPLLIIHSENDLRCPIEQAEQLYTALKLQGVETRFVRFPEENHESLAGKLKHRLKRSARSWRFRRKL
jgi:pimeloyl-ACP methyl ester carboxylesterase